MLRLSPLALLLGCTSHSYTDYQTLDVDLAFTTDAGVDVTASDWKVADWEGVETNRRPMGLQEIGSSYITRFHQAQSMTGAESIEIAFELYDMFLYGPSSVGMIISKDGQPLEASVPVNGTDIGYSKKRGFWWTFEIDTTFDGSTFGRYQSETVTSSSLAGTVTIGNDCRDSSGTNIQAGGTVGMPRRYCPSVEGSSDDAPFMLSVQPDAAEACPTALTDLWIRGPVEVVPGDVGGALDLGGDEKIPCDNSAYLGWKVCYAEASGIDADGCTWDANAVFLDLAKGTIVGKADEACPVQSCRSPLTYGFPQ